MKGTPLDLLRVCLHAWHQQTYTWDAEKYRASGLSIARDILSRIWRDHLWVKFVLADAKSTGYLCQFTILEGLEQQIQDWCLISVARSDFPDDVDAQQEGAHLTLHASKADRAVECYFNTMTKKDALKAAAGIRGYTTPGSHASRSVTGYATLGMWSAHVILRRAFESGAFPETSAQDLERFQRFDAKFQSKREDSAQLNRATLALWHPVQPDHRPLLTLLRSILPGQDVNKEKAVLSQLVKGKFGSALLRHFKRAHQIVLQHGIKSDVDFLEDEFGEDVADRTRKLQSRWRMDSTSHDALTVFEGKKADLPPNSRHVRMSAERHGKPS
ncbi:hypothetical protein Slin14017_G108010 [Septoria linicola]|nr:hypothetical protein Slin14017_G108010 [Septoria linicola]